jgi:hypothetical protein
MRLLLIAALLLGFVGLAHAQQHQPDPFAAKLPDGPGKDEVLEFCAGACHLSDKILSAHKTADEWHKTVLQMAANGAQLFPEDVDTITKYLTTYLSSAGSAAK